MMKRIDKLQFPLPHRRRVLWAHARVQKYFKFQVWWFGVMCVWVCVSAMQFIFVAFRVYAIVCMCMCKSMCVCCVWILLSCRPMNPITYRNSIFLDQLTTQSTASNIHLASFIRLLCLAIWSRQMFRLHVFTKAIIIFITIAHRKCSVQPQTCSYASLCVWVKSIQTHRYILYSTAPHGTPPHTIYSFLLRRCVLRSYSIIDSITIIIMRERINGER